jgi:hypothetical protein
MTQDLQEAESEEVVVPVVEMKLLEPEDLELEPELRRTRTSTIWKDHEVESEVSDVLVKGMTEKKRFLLFGGAMVGVSMLVYGVSKLIQYVKND